MSKSVDHLTEARILNLQGWMKKEREREDGGDPTVRYGIAKRILELQALRVDLGLDKVPDSD